ncbi:MAG: hypothetical protein JWP11_2742 [Frankiales bacterium]|nr:hypothetical protein [Frankiales bacterium]
MAVLALLAGLNLNAAAADRRRARAAADRVDATLVQVGGVADVGQFQLAVVVTNNGVAPLRMLSVRVEPAGYRLIPTSQPSSVAGGSSAQLAVHLEATCPPPAASALRIIVPLVPASGRRRELSVEVEPSLVADLARRACGDIPPFEAAQIAVSGVAATKYSVSFGMTLSNGSDADFRLLNITSPGLAVAVGGGIPVRVAANGIVALQLKVELPACSRLPPPAGRPGTERYGTLQLTLRDAQGQLQVAPYIPEPSDELLPALLALRSRICPGAGVGSGRRPRGSG